MGHKRKKKNWKTGLKIRTVQVPFPDIPFQYSELQIHLLYIHVKMSFLSFHDCNVGLHANVLRVVQLGLLTYAGFLCKTSKTHDYNCLCK